jgi:phosphatidylglycerol---prolipoprotein diacylglyceryl transferase
MYPEICSIGPVTIYSYGLMLVLAFSAAVFLACRYAKAYGTDPDIIFNFAFIGFVCGVVGARIFYVIENIPQYLKNPLEIIMFSHGGLSWFGGLILGSFAGALYLKKKKFPIYKALDILMPFLALGQAIGRIGCLLNGCCYGRASGSGIYFPLHQAQLIPTQIYSSLLLLLIYIILRHLQEKPHKEGEIFYWYLFLYSIKRFFIEFWRADNPVISWGLTLFQLLSIGLFIVAVYQLIAYRFPKRP